MVGTPRSGTTLCASILGRHSTIYMGGENHFFEDIYARREQLGALGAGATRAVPGDGDGEMTGPMRQSSRGCSRSTAATTSPTTSAWWSA